MPDSLKIGVSLLILASVFFLCASVALFFMKENERDKRVSLEVELEGVLKAKDELAKSLDELGVINKDLESKVNSANLEARGLAEDYAREKEARELLMSELDKEKGEVKRLVSEVMGEKEERVGLVQKLAQAENDYQELKEQLEVIVQAKETLEKKVKEIIAQKGIELDRIVIQTESSSRAPSVPEVPSQPSAATYIEEATYLEEAKEAADGEVLIVNKKFDFVIVDLGKSHGLDIGDNLEIYRNGKFLAAAEIEKLYDRMSAATILPEYEKANIKQGDEILISR